MPEKTHRSLAITKMTGKTNEYIVLDEVLSEKAVAFITAYIHRKQFYMQYK